MSIPYCDFQRVALAYLSLERPAIPLCPPDHSSVSRSHIEGYVDGKGMKHEGCKKPGKAPLIARWQRFGSQLPTGADIREWGQQWPHANVGGPTGPLWGVALDVDPRHGGDEQLQARKLLIPDTLTNLTGGGGVHYLFQYPGYPIPNKVAIFPGVDIRGDGGQIVLPPSLHESGRAYGWEVLHRPESTQLAPCPTWLLDALSSAPRSQGAPDQVPGNETPVFKRALSFVAFGAPIGEQRREALAAARNLLSAGKSVDDVAEAIWRGFQASPQDGDRPWTFEEALAIAQDISNRLPTSEFTYHEPSNFGRYRIRLPWPRSGPVRPLNELVAGKGDN